MEKFKNFFKKIKTKTLKFLSKTKIFISENIFLVCYIFGAILNGIILRAFTIGKVFSITPFLTDFITVLIFSSIYFLLKKKFRNTYIFIAAIISTIICVANIVYYHYYESFISITFISFAITNSDTGGENVIGNLIKLEFFILFWYPIFLIIIYFILKKKGHFNINKTLTKKKSIGIIYKWILILLCLLVCNLKGVDYGRLYTQWNREYSVSRFGIYLYQVNDIVKSLEPSMASLFGSDRANKKINEYYDNKETIISNNEYTGIFEGKNVIAIHAESIQTLVMEQSFNGEEVSPNINKLAKEGLFFNNFYSQVSFGTSSDTEFTLATSLMPINNGTVFINYADRTYPTGYKLLKDMGYYTFSMHANTGDFWNRNIMHENLGYDKFYEKSSYTIEEDEKIGFGLSDKSFVLQSVDYIEQIAKEHDKFYGTLITLSNHTPFDDITSYGEFDVSKTINGIKYPYLENTKLGNYFKSVHYADKQIGLLIEELDKRGLLDNTVIVLYGDHDARIAISEWEKLYNYDYEKNGIIDKEDPNYVELDYYWYEVNRKVPFIIWTKDETFQNNYSKTVDTAMGMYDVMPTLGNMLGFYNEHALGKDIFETEDNLVVFPNGNFLTNYVYYSDSKGMYQTLQNEPLDINYIDNMKEKTKEIMDISSQIIIYDYFGNNLK